MNLVASRPPNFAKIVAAFPKAAMPSVMFCYGDTIYTLRPDTVTPALRVHEAIHSVRQDGDPETWWDKYIADPHFRFNEELQAHIAEYNFCRSRLSRPARRHMLHQIAERLSGPLYGRVATLAQAKLLISDGVKVFDQEGVFA